MHSAPGIFFRLWPSIMATPPLALRSLFICHSGRVGLKEFHREDNRPRFGAHGNEAWRKEMYNVTVNAPAPLSGSMDVDEFMAFMETRPKGEHWDLIEGVAVMMAPASHAHQRIALNLCVLLNGAFAAQGLDLTAIFNAGVRSPGV